MNVFVSGITGRMGQQIVKLINESDRRVITGGVGRDSENAVEDVYDDFSSVPEQLVKSIDVVIDFSLPQLTESVIEFCTSYRIPLVSGTTGLSNQQKDAFKKAGSLIPVVYSENFSKGVNVVAWCLSKLAAIEGYDFGMYEIHHSKKIDAPSGTALMLQRVVEAVKGDCQKPVSVRGGGVYGVHEALFLAPKESISIKHEALDRALFAEGAIDAGRWLIRQKPGLYSMNHVIGLSF